MSETFVLIPGRTAKQGTALNQGKYTEEYKTETTTLIMNPDDMTRLDLSAGDRVRLSTEQGSIVVACAAAKPDALPSGLLFMPYGPATSQLMGAETHGTGMPDSKGLDVELEKAGE